MKFNFRLFTRVVRRTPNGKTCGHSKGAPGRVSKCEGGCDDPRSSVPRMMILGRPKTLPSLFLPLPEESPEPRLVEHPTSLPSLIHYSARLTANDFRYTRFSRDRSIARRLSLSLGSHHGDDDDDDEEPHSMARREC